jgi:uncharacterized protein YndB with AHSA1/START domain
MSEVRFDGVMPIPRAAVFDLLADARNWPVFVPGVKTVDHVEGRGAPGGRWRLTIRLLGRRRSLDCEITEFERPRLFRYLASEEGHPTATSDCQFVEVAGGTRVEISARRDPRRGPVGLYDCLVVKLALKRMLDRQMVSASITLAERHQRASDTARCARSTRRRRTAVSCGRRRRKRFDQGR